MTMTTIQFRPLNDNEFNLLSKMESAGENGEWLRTSPPRIRVAYRYQEHRPGVEYTIALVLLPDGTLLTGCTKRNPEDPPNRIKGQVEALRRAFASNVEFQPPAAEGTP